MGERLMAKLDRLGAEAAVAAGPLDLLLSHMLAARGLI